LLPGSISIENEATSFLLNDKKKGIAGPNISSDYHKSNQMHEDFDDTICCQTEIKKVVLDHIPRMETPTSTAKLNPSPHGTASHSPWDAPAAFFQVEIHPKGLQTSPASVSVGV
jgi:hypothetical protein